MVGNSQKKNWRGSNHNDGGDDDADDDDDDDDDNKYNNLLLITKLTIKTYLQLISLKKKKKQFSQSTIYKSFHFISSCSFRLKKFISIKKIISIKNNSFRLKME